MELEIDRQKRQENNIEKEQQNFLDSTIGKIINTAIDMGLRFVIPDVIEDKIIDVKNVLFQEGLQKGIQSAVDDVINIGKSAVGIITGKFDNIEQIQMAIEKGGIIESTSSLIDLFVNKVTQKGKIDNNTASLIKKGKNIILDNISSNIENMLTDQVKSIEKI